MVACERSGIPIVTRKKMLCGCVGSICVCVYAIVFIFKFRDMRVSLLLFGSVRKAQDISG